MSRLSALLCANVVFLVLAAPAAPADVQYRLTDIGDLTGDGQSAVTFVSGINDKGVIVGQTFDDQLRARAFLWQRGRMIDLGDLGFLGGQPAALSAFAINKHAAVVGTSMGTLAPSPTRAFYWRLGIILPLGTLSGSGPDTFANGINGRGEIVGAGYRAPGDLRAVRFVLGSPVELGSMADGRVAVQAFGINERGQVVGYLSPGGTVSFVHAFIWQSGEFTDLGTLPGTQLSFANALNDAGQAVGQSLDPLMPGTSSAFLWENGTLLDLGKALPAHTSSEARAINKKGVVVGTSGSDSTAAAWIWREGVTQDLNQLIAADDPARPFVQLVKANGISDKEQIAVQGFDRRKGSSVVRGYLLTPVKQR